MTRKRMISLVAAMIVATSMLGAVSAGAQTVQVTASWTAPQSGSPVDHYVVELSTNGGPYQSAGSTAGLSIDLTLAIGATYTVRVAGVDAQDRQGPYSLPSEPYTPELGPPGQPGRPIVM